LESADKQKHILMPDEEEEDSEPEKQSDLATTLEPVVIQK
jgi:hypothetical protein